MGGQDTGRAAKEGGTGYGVQGPGGPAQCRRHPRQPHPRQHNLVLCEQRHEDHRVLLLGSKGRLPPLAPPSALRCPRGDGLIPGTLVFLCARHQHMLESRSSAGNFEAHWGFPRARVSISLYTRVATCRQGGTPHLPRSFVTSAHTIGRFSRSLASLNVRYVRVRARAHACVCPPPSGYCPRARQALTSPKLKCVRVPNECRGIVLRDLARNRSSERS